MDRHAPGRRRRRPGDVAAATARGAVATEVDFLVGLGADRDDGRRPTSATPVAGTAFPGWPSPTGTCSTATSRTSPAGRCARCTPRATPPGTCASPRSSTGLFLSGDHVLPRISPNISTHARRRGRPAAGLPGLAGRGRRAARAGRGAAGPRVAVHRAGRPHRTRCASTTSTGWPSCWPRSARTRAARRGTWPAHLTWSRPWSSYERSMRVFAVTETDAHLRLLASRGAVVGTAGPVPRWTAGLRPRGRRAVRRPGRAGAGVPGPAGPDPAGRASTARPGRARPRSPGGWPPSSTAPRCVHLDDLYDGWTLDGVVDRLRDAGARAGRGRPGRRRFLGLRLGGRRVRGADDGAAPAGGAGRRGLRGRRARRGRPGVAAGLGAGAARGVRAALGRRGAGRP